MQTEGKPSCKTSAATVGRSRRPIRHQAENHKQRWAVARRLDDYKPLEINRLWKVRLFGFGRGRPAPDQVYPAWLTPGKCSVLQYFTTGSSLGPRKQAPAYPPGPASAVGYVWGRVASPGWHVAYCRDSRPFAGSGIRLGLTHAAWTPALPRKR